MSKQSNIFKDMEVHLINKNINLTERYKNHTYMRKIKQKRITQREKDNHS